MESGEQLYLQYRKGDDEAFTELIRLYKDGLILYLSGMTRDVYLAEELMEETFVKLAIHKPAFRGKSTFKTWLYAIAGNVARDWFRKNRRTVCLEETLLQTDADLEREYLRKESRITLHRALQRLKPEYAQALYLVYFEDFANGQVAQVFGKNKRQVENILYRAKKALEAELRKEGFVYEEL